MKLITLLLLLLAIPLVGETSEPVRVTPERLKHDWARFQVHLKDKGDRSGLLVATVTCVPSEESDVVVWLRIGPSADRPRLLARLVAVDSKQGDVVSWYATFDVAPGTVGECWVDVFVNPLQRPAAGSMGRVHLKDFLESQAR